MQKICLIFCLVTSWIILTATFPLGEKELDELIRNLQNIRNQYEMEHIPHRDNQGNLDLKNGFKKNAALDSDKHSLLYDYYANTMAPIYNKKTFIPIHGKRNSQTQFKEIEPIEMQPQQAPNKDQKSIYGSYSKGSFNDETDQYGFDNFYKRNFEDFGSFN